MSNKSKGWAIHPDNKISETELKYNRFVKHAMSWAKNRLNFSKHVGSKRPSVLKERIIH